MWKTPGRRVPTRLPIGANGRGHGPSAVQEALLPLVDQYVGDDGGARRPQPAARGLVAGLQSLQFLPTRGRGEQGLEFLLALREGLRRRHGLSLAKEAKRKPQ